MKTFALTVLLLGVTGVALAQEDLDSGNYLLARCNEAIRNFNGDSKAELVDTAFCLGFVTATYSALKFDREIMKSTTNREPTYCLQSGVSIGQLVRIVHKHLSDHPEKLHLDAYLLAMEAMVDAFPCPAKPK